MEIREPEMIKLSKNEKHMSLWKQILKFIGVYICISILTTIITFILFFILGILYAVIVGIQVGIVSNNAVESAELISKMTNVLFTPRLEPCITLYSTAVTCVLTALYCKLFEKRSFRSIGLQKKNSFKHYLIGLLLGGIIICITITVDFLVGGLKIEGISDGFNGTTILFIVIYFVGFMFQGASEEIMFRGFLMTDIARKNKITIAIITSSLIFSLMHIFNPGITIFELISIFLMGIFLSLYIICFDNIWGACAIHTIWNFVQVNIVGINTDLLKITDSVFKTSDITDTGVFHIIDGIIGIAFFVIAICLLLLYMKKHGKLSLLKINNRVSNEEIDMNQVNE